MDQAGQAHQEGVQDDPFDRPQGRHRRGIEHRHPGCIVPDRRASSGYLRELKKRNVKFDAVSAPVPGQSQARPGCPRCQHLGGAPRDEARRVEQAAVGHRGQLRRPARPGATGGSQAPKAATYVSRTYLDSARYGIERTFWYGWDINVLGISLSQSGRPPTRAGQAYLNTRDWMLAGSWKGCKTKGKVTTCKVGKTKILYASKKKTVKRPSSHAGVQTHRQSAPQRARRSKVGSAPIRLSLTVHSPGPA